MGYVCYNSCRLRGPRWHGTTLKHIHGESVLGTIIESPILTRTVVCHSSRSYSGLAVLESHASDCRIPVRQHVLEGSVVNKDVQVEDDPTI